MEIQTPYGLLYMSTLQGITVNALITVIPHPQSTAELYSGMGDVKHTHTSKCLH